MQYQKLHLYCIWSHGRGPGYIDVGPPSACPGHQLNSAASSGADVKYEWKRRLGLRERRLASSRSWQPYESTRYGWYPLLFYRMMFSVNDNVCVAIQTMHTSPSRAISESSPSASIPIYSNLCSGHRRAARCSSVNRLRFIS